MSTTYHQPIPPPKSSLHEPATTIRQNVCKHFFTAIQRRHLLASLAISLTTPFFSTPITQARGLFQMPPPRLTNRYFLVRAGESEFETVGIINTNPVAKTSMDNGLSEKGKKQTVKAALELKAMGACDQNCWIWPSITQRAYQAAEVIAAVNGVNRSCIVPEYSFLDARGLGAYEGKSLESLSEGHKIGMKNLDYWKRIRYMHQIVFLRTLSHPLSMTEHQTRAWQMCLFVLYNSCQFLKPSTPGTLSLLSRQILTT